MRCEPGKHEDKKGWSLEARAQEVTIVPLVDHSREEQISSPNCPLKAPSFGAN
jgi:hypothetical protein